MELKQRAADHEGDLCAVSAKANALFSFVDVDQNQEVSFEEWTKAFDRLDSDGNGFVTRKEWCLKHGTAELYDSMFKLYSVRITRDEWQLVFQAMDTDSDGMLSIKEWLQNKKRSLSSEQWEALTESPKDPMLKHLAERKKGSVRGLAGRWEEMCPGVGSPGSRTPRGSARTPRGCAVQRQAGPFEILGAELSGGQALPRRFGACSDLCDDIGTEMQTENGTWQRIVQKQTQSMADTRAASVQMRSALEDVPLARLSSAVVEAAVDGTLAGKLRRVEDAPASKEAQSKRRSEEQAGWLQELDEIGRYSEGVVRWLRDAPAAATGDRDVVLAAVARSGWALQHASTQLQADRAVVLAAIAEEASALQFAAAHLRADRDVVLAAVAQCGPALAFASEHLKADRDVVLVAVERFGLALEHAAPELKGDRDIVLAAVTQNGTALEHATADLRADRAVVLAAVAEEGSVLQHAPAHLQADRDFALAAVAKNWSAFDYLAASLQGDLEVLARRGPARNRIPC